MEALEASMERKLTAILCADVHGYSRLMGEDEEATLQALTAYRKLIEQLIQQHHGRFVGSAGDSVLAEFSSVVNATQCALEIQATLKDANANLEPNRRMEFRIGVNLGDVLAEGEQIYGDGVNVAARLESLADPGGICISGTVHEHVKNKLALNLRDLGAQRVKNIAEPVRVFRVLAEGAARRKSAHAIYHDYVRRGAFLLAGAALVIASIVLVQNLSLTPQRTSASIPPEQTPALSPPNNHSIAVLPFANLSNDQEQEYFSDGITDDLITDLSRLPGLFVIARTSSFTYKGKGAKLQDVGRELGVKYVLQGSVRRAGNQVRITAQLADASTGAELWAERYDRPLRDVFALQDEIVRRIMTTLNLQLDLAGRGIVIPRSTANFDAYDNLLRGLAHQLTLTREGFLKAQPMFERAIELDRKYTFAYALLGGNYWCQWAFLFNTDPGLPDRAVHLMQQAIALDDSLSFAHSVLATIYGGMGKPSQAIEEAKRAIELNPNDAFAYSKLADVLTNQSRPADALAALEKAMRLDPRKREDYLLTMGLAYLELGRFEEAISALKPYSARYPDVVWSHVWLAGAYGFSGDDADARKEAVEVERLVALNPHSAVSYFALAWTMNYTNRPVQALEAVEKAISLDAHNREEYLLAQGTAYNRLGRWKEAISPLKGYLTRYPNDCSSHFQLAIAYAELGQDEAARAEIAQVQRLNPEFSLKMIRVTDDTSRRIAADVSKAGLR